MDAARGKSVAPSQVWNTTAVPGEFPRRILPRDFLTGFLQGGDFPVPTTERHTPGTFCWWELATPSLESTWSFYHALFRWEKRDLALGPDQLYRICVLEGRDVGAMYQPAASEQSLNGPTGWLPYVSVESAEQSAERVRSAGGRVVTPPFAVLESGRMALCDDSEGARFALWQPKQHAGADLVREAGSVCWCELTAKDAERARRFYALALGWEPELKSLGPAGDYTYWNVPGESLSFAGMLEMSPAWGDAAPTWTTYFKVGDCDETAAVAAASGGQVVLGPFDAPGVGRLAMLEDPAGGRFSVIAFSMEGRCGGLESRVSQGYP